MIPHRPGLEFLATSSEASGTGPSETGDWAGWTLGLIQSGNSYAPNIQASSTYNQLVTARSRVDFMGVLALLLSKGRPQLRLR